MKSIHWLTGTLAVGALALACGGNDFAAERLDVSQQAASIHFKGGANAEPSFTDNGLTLSISGGLSGLGGGDIVVNLDAVGNPISTCTNPAGAKQPPGQNPAAVTLSGEQHIDAGAIKNGNVAFALTTAAPVSPIPGAPGCPNSKWTQVITDVAFTSATLTVQQGGNTFTAVCTFSSPTSNGAVPGNQVTCTTS